MLARMAISGGAPREVLDGVQSAGWSPDGTSLAVARHTGTTYQLEYPIGNVLYETPGWLDYVRVSPNGERVAFIEHPVFGDSRGSVVMTSKDKKVTQCFRPIGQMLWAWHGPPAATKSGSRQAIAASAAHCLRQPLRAK